VTEIRLYLYHCGDRTCDREWSDYAQAPDRDGFCPFCGSSLYLFSVIPDEPEEAAA
jgi:hypothetical protein